MFNSVALDVFLGLIFIFLLYSLLTTIIMEIIAHYMSLRPRLLMKALRRMLEDNQAEIFGIRKSWTALDVLTDIKESVKRYFYPFQNLPLLERFYKHPTIKYLGESKSSSKPSYMQPGNFSQTTIQLFRGDHYHPSVSQIDAIEQFLFTEAPQILEQFNKHRHWILNDDLLEKLLLKQDMDLPLLVKKLKEYKNSPIRYTTRKTTLHQLVTEVEKMGSIEDVKAYRVSLAPVFNNLPKKISAETLTHFQNLFHDAQYDIDRFGERLEIWFKETMERCTGWYKRQTQTILIILGFTIAVIGNIDTLKIYKILSKDKNVRSQMVTMAIQAQEKYAPTIDRLKSKVDTIRRSADSMQVSTIVLTTGDSLLDKTYKTLQADMENSGSMLGLGWQCSDSCKKYQQLQNNLDTYLQKLKELRKENPVDQGLEQRYNDSINALSPMVTAGLERYNHHSNGWSILGWLITALAISLGAPFWFDMLNKVIRLRSSGVREGNGKNTASEQNKATPLNRKG